jgi:DNA-binding beta-propeller fold protein YncE
MRADTRLVLAAALLWSFEPAAAQGPVHLVQTIELPRVEGRIDHLAFDANTQRLFVAALGNNTVEVLDVANARHVASVPRFREPQGIAVIPDAGLVAVANGQGEGVQMVSASDYRFALMVPLGADADNVRYDRAAKRFYVGYGAGAIAAIGTSDAKVVGSAKLAGHPESFQLERSGSRIFVNVPTAEQIAVIDRNAMKVIATWPVTAARSNYPMALDETNHRVFIGCRRPAKALIYDTANGTQIGAFDIVGDTDDMFYDSARKRLYVIGGEGFLDVYDAADPARVTRVTRVATAAGARTGLFVPEQRRVYLAVPRRGAQRAEVRVYETRD